MAGKIRGMALGAWGVPRGTVAIDFLAQRDDMEKVDTIMRGLGYECRYRTENVSQTELKTGRYSANQYR
ncbi:MAG: hypothetical protein HZA17_04875 [Nitrospirae bacterium]|nr:hypothetical protein [Nitrospirota bacterium]